MEETFHLRWGILVQAPSYCQAYGDYSDLVNCPTIDVIYIATPHSHHFQNAMLALEAGKHVLCEKSFTVNAGQAKKLFTVAEKKQRFLMEGLWTQAVTRVFADNGLGMDPYSDFPPGDRMVAKELAGGALLDLGVYSIHWVLQAMPKANRRPMQILSTTTEYPISGVDETTTILMRFAPSTADGPEIQATASASLRAITDLDGETAAVRIQGDQGEIQIYGWPWSPSRLRVIRRRPGMNNRGTIGIDKTDLLPDGMANDTPHPNQNKNKRSSTEARIGKRQHGDNQSIEENVGKDSNTNNQPEDYRAIDSPFNDFEYYYIVIATCLHEKESQTSAFYIGNMVDCLTETHGYGQKKL
ncbi:hypothetical protein BDV41DRAFT_561847 [Aspergillus transmontanensis]|uniref:D-xylose 1-dehydrogenase (NADP(+), D-xylono-1,5-lactone-forming) n=1 Tax=Aspergillus transmontanensis TaxID=1034304 RepID=A0A5N6W7T7_9EURO|nr:hypothetical protein BDV41DRAFT_561847 [Aspergillus transmontanensis]